MKTAYISSKRDVVNELLLSIGISKIAWSVYVATLLEMSTLWMFLFLLTLVFIAFGIWKSSKKSPLGYSSLMGVSLVGLLFSITIYDILGLILSASIIVVALKCYFKSKTDMDKRDILKVLFLTFISSVTYFLITPC